MLIRRPHMWAAVAVTVAFVAGCSSDENSDSSAAEDTSTPQASSQEQDSVTHNVKDALLTPSDLPEGFTVTTGESNDQVTCEILDLTNEDREDALAAAAVDFAGSENGLPLITQEIVQLTDEAADDTIARFATVPQACAEFTQTTPDGNSVTFNTQESETPEIGDKTVGFQITGEVEGVGVNGQALVIQHGNIVMLVSNITAGEQVDLALTETTARTALDKLNQVTAG